MRGILLVEAIKNDSSNRRCRQGHIAIVRRDAIQPAFEAILGVVDEVFPIELPNVERAKEILLAAEGLSARDALHLAVMERRKIQTIMSFDAGYDRFPGISRLPDNAV